MMVSPSLLSSLALLSLTWASPFKIRDGYDSYPWAHGYTDIEIMNYALSLEHLELGFYKQGLANYTVEDFVALNYTEDIRAHYEQILANEQGHTDYLTAAITALGGTPVEFCEYHYPNENLGEWLDISHTFENVGGAFYSGVSVALHDKVHLARAGGQLGLEVRQAAWIGSAVFNQNPWNTPFDVPLSYDHIYTIAGPFIGACPPVNAIKSPHPGVPFPQLLVKVNPGKSRATLTFPTPAASKAKNNLYAAFLSGNGTTWVEINRTTNEVVIPEGLTGFFFVIVTTKDGSTADAHTVAGPAVVNFPFNAHGEAITV